MDGELIKGMVVLVNLHKIEYNLLHTWLIAVRWF